MRPRSSALVNARWLVAGRPICCDAATCATDAKNSVPRTVWPMDDPTRCPVWSTPPAAPPMRGSTSMSVRVWFGVTIEPPPTPKMNSGIASRRIRSTGLVTAWAACTEMPIASVAPKNTETAASTSGRPSRVIKRPETCEPRTKPMANALMPTPESSAEKPSPCW